MELNDFKYIKTNNLVSETDIEGIWETYNNIFGFYPIGKKTCRYCIRQSLIQLIKYLTLKNLINGQK